MAEGHSFQPVCGYVLNIVGLREQANQILDLAFGEQVPRVLFAAEIRP